MKTVLCEKLLCVYKYGIIELGEIAKYIEFKDKLVEDVDLRGSELSKEASLAYYMYILWLQ